MTPHHPSIKIRTSKEEALGFIASARECLRRPLGNTGIDTHDEIDVEDVQICADFIDALFRTRSTYMHSYTLKHRAEKWLEHAVGAYGGHLSNGAFIAAAIGKGCKFRGIQGPNVMLCGFSENAIKRLLT